MFRRKKAPLTFDHSAGRSQGTRASQQDASDLLVLDGDKALAIVLSDGMGGHQYGNLAARCITSVARARLKEADQDLLSGETVPKILSSAIERANRSLATLASEQAENANMGGTGVALALRQDGAYWCSVGDSPLFLFRGGTLTVLNELHSMGANMARLAALGLVSAEQANRKALSSQLTSVLNGKAIPEIDCPDAPYALQSGDILVLASDGIDTLSPDEIASVLTAKKDLSAMVLCAALVQAVAAKANPDQDNLTVHVVKIA